MVAKPETAPTDTTPDTVGAAPVKFGGKPEAGEAPASKATAKATAKPGSNSRPKPSQKAATKPERVPWDGKSRCYEDSVGALVGDGDPEALRLVYSGHGPVPKGLTARLKG